MDSIANYEIDERLNKINNYIERRIRSASNKIWESNKILDEAIDKDLDHVIDMLLEKNLVNAYGVAYKASFVKNWRIARRVRHLLTLVDYPKDYLRVAIMTNDFEDMNRLIPKIKNWELIQNTIAAAITYRNKEMVRYIYNHPLLEKYRRDMKNYILRFETDWID